MKILQICNKPPYPPLDGGSIAMHIITKGLFEEGHEVKVLAVESRKHPVLWDKIPEDYMHDVHFESVFIDLRVKFLNALFNLFTNESYHAKRFYSKDLQTKIEGILTSEKFDIIQIESINFASYIPVFRKLSKAKIVLRAHNVEHTIWRRLAENTHNPVKKIYLRILAKRFEQFEISQIRNMDGVACISGTDADFFRSLDVKTPVEEIPFGIIAQAIPEDIPVEIPSLFFIGSMKWAPNCEGLRWFLDKIWPSIHHEFPDLKYYIAGRSTPSWLIQKRYPNVILMGEVEDAQMFMAGKSVMIAPLLSGSGVKIKVIEAMYAGKAVITTTIGAEGIYGNDKENILIADTPDDFLRAIRNCVHDPAFAERIGNNAKETILEKHQSKEIICKLISFYEKIK